MRIQTVEQFFEACPDLTEEEREFASEVVDHLGKIRDESFHHDVYKLAHRVKIKHPAFPDESTTRLVLRNVLNSVDTLENFNIRTTKNVLNRMFIYGHGEQYEEEI